MGWVTGRSWAILVVLGTALLHGCEGSGDGGGGGSIKEVLSDFDENNPYKNNYNVDIGTDGGLISVLAGEKVAKRIFITGPRDNSTTFTVRVTEGDENLNVVRRDDDWVLEYDATQYVTAKSVNYTISLTSNAFQGQINYGGMIEILEPKIIAHGYISPEGGKVTIPEGTIGVEIPAGQLESELGVSILSANTRNGDVIYSVKYGRDLTKTEKDRIDARFHLMKIPDNSLPDRRSASFQSENNKDNKEVCEGITDESLEVWKGVFKTDLYGHRIDPLNYPLLRVGTITLKTAAVLCGSMNSDGLRQDLFDTKELAPVLFIHGFTPGGGLGGGEGTWGVFRNLAKDFSVGDRGFVPFEFRWRTNARFQDVANDLAEAISLISTKTGKKVHIVAHSFGGVLVRSLLQRVEGVGSDVSGMVQDVLTLGAPHSGVFKERTEKIYGFYFPKGLDDYYPGYFARWCKQLSCYQAGVDIDDIQKHHEELGVRHKPGYIISQIQKWPWPESIPVYVGTSLIEESKFGVEFGPAVLGDGLISHDGQRFDLAGNRVNQGLYGKVIKLRDIGADGLSYGHSGVVKGVDRYQAKIGKTGDECSSAATCTHGSFKIFKEMLAKGSEFDNTINPALISLETPENLVANVFNGKAHLSWGVTSYADYFTVYVSEKDDFSIEDGEYDFKRDVEGTNQLIELDRFATDTLYFRVVANNEFGKSMASDAAYIVNDRGTVSGFVSDKATGSPLVGAKVILDIPGHRVETTTNENGYYVIKVPADIDHSVILISAEGYLSASVRISKSEILQSEYLKKDAALKKVDLSVVPVRGGEDLYHLGNDRYSGSANSQFQKKAIGIDLTLEFTLSQEQVDVFTRARLHFTAKGIQAEIAKSDVSVDGKIIGYLPSSPSDGSFRESFILFDIGGLDAGRHEIRLQSGYRDNEFWGGDYDDFEITGLYLELLAESNQGSGYDEVAP